MRSATIESPCFLYTNRQAVLVQKVLRGVPVNSVRVVVFEALLYPFTYVEQEQSRAGHIFHLAQQLDMLPALPTRHA